MARADGRPPARPVRHRPAPVRRLGTGHRRRVAPAPPETSHHRPARAGSGRRPEITAGAPPPHTRPSLKDGSPRAVSSVGQHSQPQNPPGPQGLAPLGLRHTPCGPGRTRGSPADARPRRRPQVVPCRWRTAARLTRPARTVIITPQPPCNGPGRSLATGGKPVPCPWRTTAGRAKLEPGEAEPTVCRTAPYRTLAGKQKTPGDLGFYRWQVLGSNQRRLSRRFYRLRLSPPGNGSDLGILRILGVLRESGPRLFRDSGVVGYCIGHGPGLVTGQAYPAALGLPFGLRRPDATVPGGSRLFPASAIHGRPLQARTPVPTPGVGRLRACRRHLNRLTGPGGSG